MKQALLVVLTGRTFVVQQPWADLTLYTSARSRRSTRVVAPPPESHRPLRGDVRLTPTLEVARQHYGKEPPCSGTVNGLVFDGLIWRRFDLSGFSGSLKFSTPAELQGVLVWLRHIAAQAGGKTCEASADTASALYRLRCEKSERA